MCMNFIRVPCSWSPGQYARVQLGARQVLYVCDSCLRAAGPIQTIVHTTHRPGDMIFAIWVNLTKIAVSDTQSSIIWRQCACEPVVYYHSSFKRPRQPSSCVGIYNRFARVQPAKVRAWWCWEFIYSSVQSAGLSFHNSRIRRTLWALHHSLNRVSLHIRATKPTQHRIRLSLLAQNIK